MNSLSARISQAKAKMVLGMWAQPAHPKKDVWYMSLYFGDPMPYYLKFDGFLYRDKNHRPFPIPQYVIEISNSVKMKYVKTPKKDSWYLLVADSVPSLVKFDGNFWIDVHNKTTTEPPVLIEVPPRPMVKKIDTSLDADN